MKRQKGITLIALIITIIVMLILVGVSVNVALNSGLFESAKKAKTETQAEAEKEELISIVFSAYDSLKGGVNFQKLNSTLAEAGWTGSNGSYTNKKGNSYIVKFDGTVTEDNRIETTLPEGLVEGSEFTMDADQNGTQETWIVLYKENDYIEVISKNVMEAATIGTLSSIEVEKDIDKDGDVDNIDKNIYMFENYVDILNKHCESLIKIKNIGVRSVGTNPNNPSYVNSNHADESTIQHVDEWSTEKSKQDWDKYRMLLGTTDENYVTDYNKMKELNDPENEGVTKNILIAQDSEGINKKYFLGSRFLKEKYISPTANNYVDFACRTILIDGTHSSEAVIKISNNITPLAANRVNAVRPVIRFQYK